ncbi:MAG: ATP-dependent DNA helicase RecG [Candidatus Yanofskybacteria bacterium RIFCSPLOWO2_02_FULL_43_10]|uniref:ATP-dependent DNA helicase RecG n=1 Tax=Candidatus Yanofskybacteria bacterium RIFCSPLOWO2_12_FULL_43_11b TaxID=1802710 RepID=A0A1F8H9J8_9BACT|nr:MAG: ATP-dependent DNA helicase RecG [Candidatus Yanofskybacteria bacterium RIFCSPHIGHO2_01_FULL_43_32]OGN11106.1 MAG: ATP-dependent DNA helicase RecG [Candidatus Yanofskybacteria bacterium RIFCSPHIGHO2_02_FULL_43_12]OGN17244.1 MAG: ATP-dependent DNA helicase RecG [Candidatus Yanofskybacteria bacterium RIFCSPHIGHO2_12_FULL_43_11]OGN25044.1 MAG: ATP-dependent DNA helicase RecG [Candidatus Yanofskybacteria bacterium RIFCSPLOWO2_01_FULL_43_46]OGN30123.1 MAG: ATP-dependent DNA helicase RecG [Can
MTDLSLPIEKLKSVGPRNTPRLAKLGINTVRDLLWHFPARYEDYSRVVSISEIEPGQKVNIQGEVLKMSNRMIFPKRMSITNALVGDETGAVKVVWFNQPFIANSLKEGTLVSLAGKANLDKHGLYLSSPTYEKITTDEYSFTPPAGGLTHTGGLIPVYPETEGVTSKYLRFLIKPLLKDMEAPDPLPDEIIKKHNFLSLSEAINKIHYPADNREAETAKERLAFDDLLLFQLKALLERRKLNQLKSVRVKFDKDLIQDFISRLPFELTRDQKVAAWEILKDLEKTYPMNRLMEGDVGSGKTVVALIGAVQVAKNGNQSVFMAPTEVLANQHFRTISELLGNNFLNIGLLTGSEARFNSQKVEKINLKNKIARGEVDIIIGTHAVIQKDINFKNLAFVVLDEQHRFGVAQRAALVKPSSRAQAEGNKEIVPHLLSMTATPIPRTLSLTIYGDLDISIIKEKPKNRQKIITKTISPLQRKAAYKFIRNEVNSGRQVFVICPRIELADPTKEVRGKNGQSKMNVLWAEAKAVQEEYKKLSEEVFPDLKVAMLHGKMKPKEKTEIMNNFKDKKYGILVSTSVVEVGVDIQNATIMMVENSERFGLAQLHQFRGRVGRGEYQSYCLLFSSTPDKNINQRLKALVDCDDGFELAEKDMTIRGPGEFFGVKQSGLPDLAMASLANVELIKRARLEARLLLKDDSDLSNHRLLKEKLDSFQRLTHFE